MRSERGGLFVSISSWTESAAADKLRANVSELHALDLASIDHCYKEIVIVISVVEKQGGSWMKDGVSLRSE